MSPAFHLCHLPLSPMSPDFHLCRLHLSPMSPASLTNVACLSHQCRLPLSPMSPAIHLCRLPLSPMSPASLTNNTTHLTSCLTLRVSCLYHELLDDSVEDVAVIVAVPSVDTEVLDSLGTLLEEQLQVDVTHAGVQGRSLEYPLSICTQQQVQCCYNCLTLLAQNSIINMRSRSSIICHNKNVIKARCKSPEFEQ